MMDAGIGDSEDVIAEVRIEPAEGCIAPVEQDHATRHGRRLVHRSDRRPRPVLGLLRDRDDVRWLELFLRQRQRQGYA